MAAPQAAAEQLAGQARSVISPGALPGATAQGVASVQQGVPQQGQARTFTSSQADAGTSSGSGPAADGQRRQQGTQSARGQGRTMISPGGSHSNAEAAGSAAAKLDARGATAVQGQDGALVSPGTGSAASGGSVASQAAAAASRQQAASAASGAAGAGEGAEGELQSLRDRRVPAMPCFSRRRKDPSRDICPARSNLMARRARHRCARPAGSSGAAHSCSWSLPGLTCGTALQAGRAGPGGCG